MQKRRMNTVAEPTSVNDENSNSINVGQMFQSTSLPKLTKADVKQRLTNIGQLIAGIYGENSVDRLNATIEFRRMLSVEDSPPIQAVIDAGVVPRLMKFLAFGSEEKLQFEAAW